MPKINVAILETLSEEEKEIVSHFIKKDGSIRATKPKIVKNDSITGKAAYVWRMVVFLVSPISQHHCMPVTADFDLPGDFDERNFLMKELKPLEDKIVNSIPKSEWHGVKRWARLF